MLFTTPRCRCRARSSLDAGIIRWHRASTGSLRRRLNLGQQALPVLVHPRKGEVAVGFGWALRPRGGMSRSRRTADGPCPEAPPGGTDPSPDPLTRHQFRLQSHRNAPIIIHEQTELNDMVQSHRQHGVPWRANRFAVDLSVARKVANPPSALRNAALNERSTLRVSRIPSGSRGLSFA